MKELLFFFTAGLCRDVVLKTLAVLNNWLTGQESAG